MTDSLVAVLGRGVIDPSEPIMRADDLGLGRGDGCFETCRLITPTEGSGTIQNLGPHLARLRRSLDQLEITSDVAAIEDLIALAAQGWHRAGEAALKVMVTRGLDATGSPTQPGGHRQTTASVIVTIHPVSRTSLAQRKSGIRVVTLARGTSADAYTDAGWLLGGVKSLSYAVNMASLREAARRDADDAIWISTEGQVLEAPTATVVWAEGSRLLTTPTGASGILDGTTVGGLFASADAAGFDTGTAVLDVADLPSVDAIWLVSSVRGIVEVVELDGAGRQQQPELTGRLQALAGF